MLLEVEETAIQIEQPFGFEYNDLPLDSYCLTVQVCAACSILLTVARLSLTVASH